MKGFLKEVAKNNKIQSNFNKKPILFKKIRSILKNNSIPSEFFFLKSVFKKLFLNYFSKRQQRLKTKNQETKKNFLTKTVYLFFMNAPKSDFFLRTLSIFIIKKILRHIFLYFLFFFWMLQEELNEIISMILFDSNKDDKHTTDKFSEEKMLKLIRSTKDFLKQENILLRLSGDFVVVGDIHGNIDDLIRIFEKEGYPPKKQYIFLGDYVDRGQYSLEVITLLFAIKLRCPRSVFLLRGNHEGNKCTKIYGFKDDCIYRFNKEIYREFLHAFAELPIAAVVNQSVMCVHGGISQNIKKLEDLEDLFKDYNIEGEIADLLWSDPSNSVKCFSQSDRKQGHKFNHQALCHFFQQNGLSMLIRGHSFCQNGYSFDFGIDGGCLTVFSTCDYTGLKNCSGIAVISTNGEVTAKAFQPAKDRGLYRRVVVPKWFLSNRITPNQSPILPTDHLTNPNLFMDPPISLDLLSQLIR